MTKAAIIDSLGESALLLPQKLAEALGANERVKLYFSLLQAAERHANHPEEPVAEMVAPERAAGPEADLALDVTRGRREAQGDLYLPGAARIRQAILDALTAMHAPLALAGIPVAADLAARKRALERALVPFTDDRVPKGVIAEMTRVASDTPDSLHRLVMDLHRALNTLQSDLAQETIEGARAWHIDPPDRARIRAFMAGINDTAPLKFSHPGLGTTATRVGPKLIIQNDIGTTEAHVLVLHVEEHAATLTYSDVHRQRIAFLRALLAPFTVQWTDAGSSADATAGEGAEFHLTIGRFAAADDRTLERFLTFLGSRIVFLIDWNRARKDLREFLPKADAVRLLKWAADNKLGHRGFLEVGGERLVAEAIEFAQPTRLRYGERLYEALGVDAAFEYLQFVLREAASGLLEGRSERFIRDEIKAELARRFRSAHASLLSVALTHAERVFDLASEVHEGLAQYDEAQCAERLERTARRARKWEQECDAVVSRVRSLAERLANPGGYADVMHEADEVADGLEEAAFLMTHLPTVAPPSKLVQPVQELAASLVAGAQESVKMFESARHVTREGAREDFQDFFAAVDRLVALERETDTAERVVTTTLLAVEEDARALHLLSRLSGALEGAADALSRAALKLRDCLLAEIMTG